ncbi:hypothetical protein [Clostridium facile]|uniref:Lipoprotein n=1 Tax=Clostridium facile TaxID=2763035 RepID=A0ABR7IPB5_9CLOT|nr:hypothetical protein [Clostridium facile]MBC5786933.1 hypothetical protein [Clostridium facile]
MKKIVACMMGFVLAAGCLSGCGGKDDTIDYTKGAWIDHSTGPVDYEVPQEWGEAFDYELLDMDTTTYSVDDFSLNIFYTDLSTDEFHIYSNLDESLTPYVEEEKTDDYSYSEYTELSHVTIAGEEARHFSYLNQDPEDDSISYNEVFAFETEDGYMKITASTDQEKLGKNSMKTLKKLLGTISV